MLFGGNDSVWQIKTGNGHKHALQTHSDDIINKRQLATFCTLVVFVN